MSSQRPSEEVPKTVRKLLAAAGFNDWKPIANDSVAKAWQRIQKLLPGMISFSNYAPGHRLV